MQGQVQNVLRQLKLGSIFSKALLLWVFSIHQVGRSARVSVIGRHVCLDSNFGSVYLVCDPLNALAEALCYLKIFHTIWLMQPKLKIANCSHTHSKGEIGSMLLVIQTKEFNRICNPLIHFASQY